MYKNKLSAHAIIRFIRFSESLLIESSFDDY